MTVVMKLQRVFNLTITPCGWSKINNFLISLTKLTETREINRTVLGHIWTTLEIAVMLTHGLYLEYNPRVLV